MVYCEITPAKVVQMITEVANCLIIDCRSFLVFNKGHVTEAINIRCNSIMRRRSKGLFALENAITNAEKRQNFLSGKYAAVVVYDDQGGNLFAEDNAPLKCKRTATMVVDVLQQNAPEATQVFYMNCKYLQLLFKY